MAEPKEKREKERKGPSLLEWIAAAIGALLVIGILTFMAMEAISSKVSGPPILEVTPVAIAGGGRSHVVEIKVTNRSGRTAAAVEIQGELRQGGQTLETSNATLNYVPGHSCDRPIAATPSQRTFRIFESFRVREVSMEGRTL